MKKRIVTGSFEIESNSLTAILTTKSSFHITVGEDPTGRTVAPAYFRELGCEVIEALYAAASPGGRMVYSEFESMLNDLLNRIPAEGIDGVWLLLHGAMDVEKIGSGDLAIAKAVRRKIGPTVPIAIAFDLHADIDPQIAAYVNVICGFRTAPHVDIERTQIHAAQLLLKCIDLNYLPKPMVVKVPIIAKGDSMTTDVYPGDALIQKLWALEKENDLMCLSIFLGNPWVDAACAGGAVIAIPNPGQEAIAKAAAIELAEAFWRIRNQFKFRAKTANVEDGLNWALAQKDTPVFLSDSGDNVSGGGSGDNAALIDTFLKKGIQNTFFAGIADANVVAACRNRKEGEIIECTLGGTLDPASTRIAVRGILKKHGYVMNWPQNTPVESVLLEIAGNDVLVNAERTVVVKLSVFDAFGIAPENYRIVVLKLGYLWPEFYSIAKDFLMLLTKGSTCEVVEDCDFHHVPRPIYPLDWDMEWKPALADE